MNYTVLDLPQDQNVDDVDLTSLDDPRSEEQTGALPYHTPDTSSIPSVQHETSSHNLFPSYDNFSDNALEWSGFSHRSQFDSSSYDHLFYIPDIAYIDPGVQDLSIQGLNITDTYGIQPQNPRLIDPALLVPGVDELESPRSLSLEEAVLQSNRPPTIPQYELYNKVDADTPSEFWALDSASSVGESSYSHGQSVVEGGNYTCMICDKAFQRAADLRRHKLSHADPQYSCKYPGCSKSFYRVDKLRDHVRQAHGAKSLGGEEITDSKPSTFECEKCELKFNRRADLNSHQRRKHDRRYRCHECGRSFHLHADLNRHERTAHIRSQVVFMCEMAGCSYTCSRKDNLLRHGRAKHGSQALVGVGSLSKSI